LSEGADNANKKEDVKRKFITGERVRIINPGSSQATTGTIVKIGTVQTRNGDKIIRAAKNLIIE
jgi:predicted transcriptional regulator